MVPFAGAKACWDHDELDFRIFQVQSVASDLIHKSFHAFDSIVVGLQVCLHQPRDLTRIGV